MVQVEPIKAFSDNYIWALSAEQTEHIIVVDPGQAEPVISYLEDNNKELAAILVTHHHWDHTTGIAELKQRYPDAHVYGPQNSPFEGIETTLCEGDNLTLLGYDFTIMATPGHTLDHICYISEGFIFCGDTLFSGGCGRLFEGSAEQMWQSLQKLRALPDDTQVYCTHEYTQANMKFACACDDGNQDVHQYLRKVNNLREQDAITLPSTIGLEKRINPFLRPEHIAMQRIPVHLRPGEDSAEAKFAALRKWKDNF